MRKKILIFGGGGFVGRNLARLAVKEGWQVVLADRTVGHDEVDIEWLSLDITDKDQIEAALSSHVPNTAVNVAAMADIDKVENNKELAYKINVLAANYIAESCRTNCVKHIFFSSDAVFKGTKAKYTEEDKRQPVNYYGKTKMMAEDEVLKANPDSIIVRLSLILGFTVAGGNSFLEGLELKLKKGEVVLCPPDEIRTPVDILTLCEYVLELAQSDFSGVIQLGSKNSISRFEMTKILAEKLGYDPSWVQIQTDPPKGRAARHKNGIISVKKAESILKTPMLHIEQTIERALQSRTTI